MNNNPNHKYSPLNPKVKNQIVVYENGEVEIEVSFDNEKEIIWLSQVQISKLLETSTDNISLHFKNIYQETVGGL